jgi:hypothetical protein
MLHPLQLHYYEVTSLLKLLVCPCQLFDEVEAVQTCWLQLPWLLHVSACPL